MSFFENIFSRAKKIVSDGKETLRDLTPSSKVSYTAPKPNAPVYANSKYAKDPLMDLVKAKPKVQQAQWGVAVKKPEQIKMNTAQSTQESTQDNPADVISGIIQGGKVALKTTPVIAKEVGQGSMRAYAGLGGLATGNNLTPRGKFQEALYGTDEEISLRSVGEEIVPEGSRFAPAVGFAVGALDLVGGGKAIRGIKTLDELAQVRKGLSVIDTTRTAGKSKILSVNTDALLGEDITGYKDLDLKTVSEYKAKIEKGEKIEPLIVQVKDGNVYVEDGKHRLAALRELGIDTVDVVEKPIYTSTAKKGTAMDIKPKTKESVILNPSKLPDTVKTEIENIRIKDTKLANEVQSLFNKTTKEDFADYLVNLPDGIDNSIAKSLSKEDLIDEFLSREPAENILNVPRFKDKTMYAGAVGGIEEDEEGNISIDPLKAALGIAGVGALQKSGAITKIDQLIAAGKVRVVSRDGKDVYQVKKGDTWVSKRDEDTALKAFDPKPKAPSKAVELPEELQQRIIANDIAREAIEADPAKQLSKYVAKRGNSKGLLAEVTGQQKSKTGFGVDVRTADLGYENSEEARQAYEVYRTRKADFEAETSQIRLETRLARAKAKEKSIADSVPKKAPRVNPSEVKSLESTARQLVEAENLPPVKRPLSLEEIVTRTPLSKKVAWWDYLRTPDRVLEKIGFGKEAKLLRMQYEEYAKELPKNLDRVEQWFKQVPKESNVRLFQYLDGKDIKLTTQEQKVADEIKAYLKEWADRLKLPEDNRIAHYITHIFDDQLIAKEFDEDLAKLIDEKVPGQVYDPFLEKRLGAKGYKEDVWAALDAYTKRATRKVHMDVALEKVRDKAGSSLEFSNLEKSQFKYIQEYIDRVNMRPTEIDNLIDTSFKQIFGYRLGQRPVVAFMRGMRRLTYLAFLGGNLASGLRNLSQGVNTYAVLGEKYTAIGYAKLFNSKANEELIREGILSNTIIQDRSINATKKALEKIDKSLYIFFDRAEKINRGAAYFGAKSKYINENMHVVGGQEVWKSGSSMAGAVDYAKDIVRKTQFVYDSVDTPLLLSSDIMKTAFQLQTYTVKQTEFLTELVKDRNFAALVRYAIGGYAFVYTIGQTFGMEPKELLPLNLDTGSRFELAPSLKIGKELFRAGVDAPDKYGNDRSTTQKAKDIGEGVMRLIPGSSQAKKTYQGYKSIQEGGSYDKAGRLQFIQGQSPAQKLQSLLFGKYASEASDGYFDKQDLKKDALKEIKPVYDQFQKLKAEGKDEEGQVLIDSLTPEEYENYKAYKTQVTKEKNAEIKKKMVPVYLDNQQLKKEGRNEEVQASVDAMTDEEYKAYEAVKKDAEALGVKPTERNAVETVGAYAKAFLTDSGNASKALFTNEKLGRVEGNLVELKRFYGRDYKAVNGSEAYIYKQLQAMGIDAKDRQNYNLEHIVPVSAGGDSSPENLRVVDRPTHDSWTPFDIMLGDAVKSKKINRKRAEKIARDYKNGVISLDEAKGMIE